MKVLASLAMRLKSCLAHLQDDGSVDDLSVKATKSKGWQREAQPTKSCLQKEKKAFP
jgi:hypothetical protein